MRLTKLQKDFCEEYVKNGYNGTKAYRSVSEGASDTTAKSNAWQLLRRPKIIDYIGEVEDSFKIAGFGAGISRDTIVKILADTMMNARKIMANGDELPDYTAKLNAIEKFTKLSGEMTDRAKIDLSTKNPFGDVDLSKLKPEERQEMEKDIINSFKK